MNNCIQKVPVWIFHADNNKIWNMPIGDYCIYREILYTLENRSGITEETTIQQALINRNIRMVDISSVLQEVLDIEAQRLLDIKGALEQQVRDGLTDSKKLIDGLTADIVRNVTDKIAEINSLADRLNNTIQQKSNEFDNKIAKADQNLQNRLNSVLQDLDSNLVPVGSIIHYLSNTVPKGFLICNGAEVSRVKYEKLFRVIGTTYGDGNGSDTFNIPDFRGVFLRGLGGNSNSMGVRQEDAIRDIVGVCNSPAERTYGASSGAFANDSYVGSVGGHGFRVGSTTFKASRVVPTANENRPVNYSVNFLIKF